MKILNGTLRKTLPIVVASLAFAAPLFAEETPPGYVDFGTLTPSAKADQFVEVNMKGALLKLAAQLTKKSEPDVAELLSGIQQVRVNVVGLDKDNREAITQRITEVRSKLEGKGWERVVQAKERTQDVSVYLKNGKEGVLDGVVVTVLDGAKEAVFVNVVGSISLDQIGKLGEKLDIAPLKQIGGKLDGKKPATPAEEK